MVAEPDVRRQRRGEAGRGAGTAATAGRRSRPSGRARAADPARRGPVDLEQAHPGPVPGRRCDAAACQGHPVAVDGDHRVLGAPQVPPQLAERVGEGDTGGAFAHPVEHLGVGRAVGVPGAGRVARADSGQQRARRAARGERPDERGGRAVAGRGGLPPSPRRWSSGRRRAPAPPGSPAAPARRRQPGRPGPARPARRGGPARTWSPRPRGTGRADRARRRTRRARARRRPAPGTPSSPSRRGTRPGPAGARPRGAGAGRWRAPAGTSTPIPRWGLTNASVASNQFTAGELASSRLV